MMNVPLIRLRPLILLTMGFALLAFSPGDNAITADEPSPVSNLANTKEATKSPAEGHDYFGDPLPEDAVARLGTVRFRHEACLTSAAFSPDGTLVASADHAGGVRVWDVKSGMEVAKFVGKIRGQSVAFPADGKTLLAVRSSGPTIQEWDLATAELVREVRSTEESRWDGYSLSISPDCRLVGMIGVSDHCGIYDVKTCKPVLRLKKLHAFISCVLSHDGKTLATAGWDEVLRLWDVASSKELRRCPARGRWVDGMQFSPNDATLAVATGGTLQVLEVSTAKEVFHVANVAAGRPAYSPDGNKLFAGRLDTVRVWETARWKEVAQLGGAPDGSISHLIVSADGKKAAAAGGDHVLQVWDLANGSRLNEYESHRGEVLCVSFSPDGKTVVSGGDDGFLSIWDRNTGQLRRRLAGHKWHVLCAAVSPDGKSVASGDGLLHCFGNKEKESIRLWELSSGKLLRAFPAHRNGVSSLAFSPDGQSLASAGLDAAVGLWDPGTGTRRQRLTICDPQAVVSSITFSKDGKALVVGNSDGEVKLWRLQTSQTTEVFHSRERVVVLAALLPDGKALVSAGRGEEGGITFMNLIGDRVEHERNIRLPNLKCCVVSPDGTLLGSADEWGPIRVWSIKTGEILMELSGHRGAVSSLAFSPDSTVLASGSTDTTVLLWDLQQAQLNRRWLDLGAEADSVAKKVIDSLIADPKHTTPYLGRRLQQAAALENQVARLVDGLDADDFNVRERATQDLLQLGPGVGLALRQVLRGEVSAEVRKRIADIMDRLRKVNTDSPHAPIMPLTKDDEEALLLGTGPKPKPEAPPGIAEERSSRRAFEVLVRIGTPEARQILMSLAGGDGRRWFSQRAKASLERLE